MIARQSLGLLGSVLGLAFPLAALTVVPPPLGWEATGGGEALSLLMLDPARPAGWPIPSLLLADKSCPGVPIDGSYRALVETGPAPDRYAYRGLVACVLASASGRVVAVRISDSEGRRTREPDMAAAILAGWRFEPRRELDAGPSWHRVRLDSLASMDSALRM
jgi:hypothetical protein